MRRARSLLLLLAACAPGALSAADRWYKGNLHAHANWGAAQLPTTSPDVVIRWYREHGYHFAAVPDLNAVTPTEGLKALFDAPEKFLVVPGTEPNQEPVAGTKIVDTLGIGVMGPVAPEKGETVVQVLDAQAKAIRRAGGLPIAAHPNLTWAITAKDLVDSDRGPGPRFFELLNGEPGMNDRGGGGRPSTEQIWDEALSSGRLVYGIAADDAHHFGQQGPSRRADEPLALPGKAWIMVRAPELSVKALLAAMERGDFYATTGVLLEDYAVSEKGIRLRLSDRPRDLGWSLPGANPHLYRTEFVGGGGTVLKVDESLTPSYDFTGREQYVRARVTSSDGLLAFTQPVWRSPRPSPRAGKGADPRDGARR